jgi:hypothetical protein
MRSTYPYKSIAEIVAANQRAEQTWFSDFNMRFFGTEIHDEVYDGAYFITSEQDDYVSSRGHRGGWDGNRMYSIRIAMPDGTIDTVGDFGAYETLEQAIEAVHQLIGRSHG